VSEPLVVCYGLGVDSTALLVGLAQRSIRPDLILFADTGGEKPETYAFADEMNEWLRAREFPEITVVKNVPVRAPYTTLEGALLHTQTLPPPAFGFKTCSMRWKIEPQEKFLEGWGPAIAVWKQGARVITAIGYDADETRRSYTAKDTPLYRRWLPLREWGWNRDRCKAEIEAAGLRVPPKSACFFCPYNKADELRELATKHPDLWERAVALEDLAFASGKIKSDKIRGLGRRFSWRDFAAKKAA
jgi:hypothetical protein